MTILQKSAPKVTSRRSITPARNHQAHPSLAEVATARTPLPTVRHRHLINRDGSSQVPLGVVGKPGDVLCGDIYGKDATFLGPGPDRALHVKVLVMTARRWANCEPSDAIAADINWVVLRFGPLVVAVRISQFRDQIRPESN